MFVNKAILSYQIKTQEPFVVTFMINTIGNYKLDSFAGEEKGKKALHSGRLPSLLRFSSPSNKKFSIKVGFSVEKLSI